MEEKKLWSVLQKLSSMRTEEPTLRGTQHPTQQPSKRGLAAGMPMVDAENKPCENQSWFTPN